jgi:hypothetical protein
MEYIPAQYKFQVGDIVHATGGYQHVAVRMLSPAGKWRHTNGPENDYLTDQQVEYALRDGSWKYLGNINRG